METLKKLALAITIIGALNWGVVGIFRFDVIAQLTEGAYQPLARFLYVVIGLSGLMTLGVLFNYWQQTDEEPTPAPSTENA
ncbi:DUF378 domain-containing protein [Mammaliicoccus sciuri]|uniref:DUF378 domain-containing protein n=2 Tax=Sporosarcina newyorkensis TaxID=759851 RepID=A0A1T4YJP8_9BACL|nr:MULTISPECIES: DUF378 domain-containing protein [Sporosarcina]EGQ21268.1 hypothetical protein HMPREF9372_3305 [Sporosarcina newyorkensis 2681]MBY0221039.1 DUF378 domain-containing protein [Sporosarcina aquimarina]SKB01903.1 hypothetical protein SAMN04244570_2840 [Sporosarcina newyorkensis]